jgi:hypothetical protein
MKYTIEMASGGTMYILSFMKIGAGIERLLWGGVPQTGELSQTPAFSFSK